MIGIIPATKVTADNYLQHFDKQFPDAQTKRQYALRLLPDGDIKPGAGTYPTRAVLAAHWADERPQTIEKAKTLYDLASTTQKLAGQTVLRVTGIDISDLLSNTAQVPEYGLSVDIATLEPEGKLEYLLTRAPAQEDDSALPTDARALQYNINSMLSPGSQALELSRGEVGIYETYAKTLPVYAGTVCLENNRNLYHATRQESTTEGLVFGNRRSFAVLSKVVQLIGDDAEKEFIGRINSSEISLDQPVPDLNFLAS
jgi:hypothetical protein